ncbi:MAG TPA: dihydropteroate synthase [Solirubrobacteraceae bacterium]|nr:dihydropteroate synthase [Solirubrobacteraceae bacterium]
MLSTKLGAPLIMGIVNIGNDSVADDKLLPTLDAQYEFAMKQHADGAHIIDLGVQSGRTDTPILPVQDEIDQLIPLVSALAAEGILVSVDVWRAPVVEAALDAGAALINDVSGLSDVTVADLAGSSGAGLVVMHTRTPPKTERFPGYEDDDPMADVVQFLGERIDTAEEHGVSRDQIIVDPGLDYAKTPRESVAVLRRLVELRRFGRPILLAVSRKYFIGMLTGKRPEDRLAGTLAALEFGVTAGADIVRVHDVDVVAEFLRLRFSLYGVEEPEMKGSMDEEILKWLPPKRSRK